MERRLCNLEGLRGRGGWLISCFLLSLPSLRHLVLPALWAPAPTLTASATEVSLILAQSGPGGLSLLTLPLLWLFPCYFSLRFSHTDIKSWLWFIYRLRYRFLLSGATHKGEHISWQFIATLSAPFKGPWGFSSSSPSPVGAKRNWYGGKEEELVLSVEICPPAFLCHGLFEWCGHH